MDAFHAHQADTAQELGYNSVEAMNAEHDRFHHRICAALGLVASPTLWAVSHDEELDHDWVRLEEAMVLAAQRFMNAWRSRQ
jgi:hypothetical protein